MGTFGGCVNGGSTWRGLELLLLLTTGAPTATSPRLSSSPSTARNAARPVGHADGCEFMPAAPVPWSGRDGRAAPDDESGEDATVAVAESSEAERASVTA